MNTRDARWARALKTFDDIVRLDATARLARLDEIGAADPELRQHVEELLAADEHAEARLARIEDAFRAEAPKSQRMPGDDPLHLAGRNVSHFHVVQPLAYGGMGVVYRAIDLRLQRAIALKFHSRQLPLSRARERFLQEARAAGALDHPNVCSIYEAGETAEGQLFFAMPLYEGETLKTRLARVGRYL
jgi:hypothetical protein